MFTYLSVWLVLCLLGVDFFYCGAHRLSHEMNLLWTGHVVHHQSEEYNLSVALRQSTFQKFFTTPFYWPLALLGFKSEWFLVVSAINLLYQFWIHTEIVGKMPVFEWLFNSPSHHRVHHGRDPKYIDRNHGGTLIIWDRMFGTFQAEEETPTYGITKPVNTWEPVNANLKPFKDLWHEMREIRSWWSRFLLLWKPPGWMPKENGGFRAPEPVDKTRYAKFHIHLPLALNAYLLTHYLLLLGGTAVFLFTKDTYSAPMQVGLALLILFSVLTLGWLFEARKSGIWVEGTRLMLSSALLWWAFWGSSGFLLVAAATTLTTVLSVSVLLRYKVSLVYTGD